MATKKKISKKNLGTSFDRLLSYNLKDDGTIDDQMIENYLKDKMNMRNRKLYFED